ncbi:MAG: lasso peptide biosynthesis B2 protein [Bacteroidales bacterium]
MLNLLLKYYKLSSIEKRMFLEAYVISFYSRLLILLLPFKSIEKKLGNKSPTFSKYDHENKKLLVLIKRSILRSAKYSIWRNKCFEQSLTAAIMLKKRKYHYILHLGLAKKENKLIAHVWIESNGYYLVNKGNIEYCTLLTYFG